MTRALSPEAGALWYERMQEYAELAESDGFRAPHLRQLKRDLANLVWLRDGRDVHDTLHNVFHHVWNRLDGPLSIDQLAAAAGYTPNYLNDLAREHTGRSLGRWIADMRMARARSYLEITDEAIADVGAACGYDDPAYFSRAFRRAHNVSPVTWRLAARPNDARHPNVTLTMGDIKATQRRAASVPRVYSIAS
jgi:transcriptional regulator GlxA family with amidase domain